MLDGLLLLNKPSGKSSRRVTADVLSFNRKLKTGHVGTLDPLASGLLPVLIGRATKLQDFLLGSNKVYEFEVEFGSETETLDAEGEVFETDPSFILPSSETISTVLQKFIGGYVQSPPLYSAVKKNGVSLHKLVRDEKKSSIELEQIAFEAAKHVSIYSLVLLERTSAKIAKFRVESGKGCYVRSLARDIAFELKTKAYCKSICRIQTAQYDLKEATSIEKFSSKEELQRNLIPLNRIKMSLPFVAVSSQISWMNRFLNGMALLLDELSDVSEVNLSSLKEKKMFFMITDAGEMLGLSAVYEVDGKVYFRLKRRI